jgi:hypothetical protein
LHRQNPQMLQGLLKNMLPYLGGGGIPPYQGGPFQGTYPGQMIYPGQTVTYPNQDLYPGQTAFPGGVYPNTVTYPQQTPENIYPTGQQWQTTDTGAPTNQPPNFTPPKPQMAGVTEDMLMTCIDKLSYIWLVNGINAWSYIKSAGNNQVSLYYWNGSSWAPIQVTLQQIEAFACT